jgi:homogentisate 1,2-dioxygenase
LHYDLSPGEFEVRVKQGGSFTSYRFDHHPCDVIGWDGVLAPFRFNIRDFKPITSWRAHIPPSAYCTFFGQGFEICSFVPRPVESAERSLPVPFDHMNQDRDEIVFYSEGVFFSKDSSESGTLTFHARGFSHGPHQRALHRAMERRDQEGAYMLEGYFLLVETNLPLSITPWAETLEDKDYLNSWAVANAECGIKDDKRK